MSLGGQRRPMSRIGSLGAGGISHGQNGVTSLVVSVDMAISLLSAPPAPYPDSTKSDIPLLSSSDGAKTTRPSPQNRNIPLPILTSSGGPSPKSPPPPLAPPITPPHPSPPARPETLVTLSPFPGLTDNVPVGHNRLSSPATAALQYTPVHVEVGRDQR